MKNILARTLLRSHSGQEYIYEIYFRLDTGTGEVKFTSESGELQVRPYMLLNLFDEVFTALELPFLDSGEVATLLQNKGGHKKNQASLKTSDGYRYRLKQEIDGKWIDAIFPSQLHEMIRYFHNLKKRSHVPNTIAVPGSVGKWYNPEWVWKEVT